MAERKVIVTIAPTGGMATKEQSRTMSIMFWPGSPKNI